MLEFPVNATQSDGYNLIMDEIRQGDMGDPWGVAMDALVAIAEVTYTCFGEILDGYEPSPFLSHGLRSMHPGFLAESLYPLVDARDVTLEDLTAAYTVMDRYRALCVLAGRDY